MAVTPLVADYAGPSELVDNKTGIRIPFRDRASLVEGLRGAIANIVRFPAILDPLGAAAREKVLRDLTWEAKARQVTDVYDAILSGRERPNPFKFAE